MTQNGIAVSGTDSIDDHERFARILKTAIKTAENVVTRERQRRDGETPDEELELSPSDLLSKRSLTLAELETALPSLTIENRWQHEDWQPGDPCPECGGEEVSVIKPREYVYTYDDEGLVTDSRLGEASGPAMNHHCTNCFTTLSQHPATALFRIE